MKNVQLCCAILLLLTVAFIKCSGNGEPALGGECIVCEHATGHNRSTQPARSVWPPPPSLLLLNPWVLWDRFMTESLA